MTRITKLSSFGVLILGGVFAGVPTLQARTCGGAGDIVGSFGWLATRTVTFVAPAPATTGTTTGTTTTTTTATTTASTTTAPATPVTGSSTTIGTLVAGALNGNPFTSVGRMYFDGAGNVLSSASPGGATSTVGTYTVNADCTLSATLTDAFLPSTSSVGIVTASTKPSATFEGIAVLTGNQLNMTQTGAVTGTSITLQKTKQICTNADLFSAYGISASGYLVGSSTSTTTNAGTTTTTSPNVPFSILGRLVADGAGTFYEDNIGLSSPLASREITGTYSVSADCTGAASLVTSDGTKHTASFAIVAAGPSLATGQQSLLIRFTDTGVFGFGLAQQQ